jgi:GR25 family glycosyltransferase involved in LPS biosynthesis
MFQGLYINLDKRPDRRAHIEAELARFGLQDRYRRLPAYSQPTPTIGCYRSHLRALEEARTADGIFHVLEDDSILSDRLRPFIETSAPPLLEQYDLLFLDMWVDQQSEMVSAYQTALDRGDVVVPLGEGGPRIGATSSYLVNPRRAGRVHHLVRKHQHQRLAIDMLFDNLAKAGELRAAVAVPFVTGVDARIGSTSDIQRMSSFSYHMFAAQRARFFVDRETQLAP